MEQRIYIIYEPYAFPTLEPMNHLPNGFFLEDLSMTLILHNI